MIFEWLIVNDGSTDNIRELVEIWQNEAELSIGIFGRKMEVNTGHVALVCHRRQEYFFTLDSDDEIVPNTLERFHYHWNVIPRDQRSQFAGVAGQFFVFFEYVCV